MVSEALIGAMIGGGAAIGGAFLQAKIQRKNAVDRISAEVQKKRVDYYLEKEANLVFECIEKLHEMHSLINRVYHSLQSLPHHSELQQPMASAVSTFMTAKVFISEKAIEDIDKVVEYYVQFIGTVSNENIEEFEFDEYSEAYAVAVTDLQVEVHKILGDFASDWEEEL